MKKFIDSLLKFIDKLTFEKWQSLYRQITRIEGSEFVPHYNVSKAYFDFIKSWKPNLTDSDILACVLAPRECQKTTTFSVVLPIIFIEWSFKDYNDLTTIIIGSYRLKKTRETIFKRLRNILKNMEIEIIQNEKETMTIKKFEKEIKIYLIHPKEDLRSFAYGHHRPQYIILDDLDTPASLSLGEEIRLNEKISIVRNFRENWLPAREQKNSLIYAVGNFESNISILKLLDEMDFVHKLKLKAKDKNKYLLPIWNEEWEKKMRKAIGDEAFERQYLHLLPTDKYTFAKAQPLQGLRYSLIDIGKTNDSLVSVNLIGKTIMSITYGSYTRYKNFIQELRNFDPEEIYFDSTSNQEYFGMLLEQEFPKAKIFGMDASKTQLNKHLRMLLALLKLESGEITLNSNDEVLESIMKEEIEKMKENSHVLDILGTFLALYTKIDYQVVSSYVVEKQKEYDEYYREKFQW